MAVELKGRASCRQRALSFRSDPDRLLADLMTFVPPAGFSDQSQFTRHFKRHLGVTPGRFRAPARTA